MQSRPFYCSLARPVLRSVRHSDQAHTPCAPGAHQCVHSPALWPSCMSTAIGERDEGRQGECVALHCCFRRLLPASRERAPAQQRQSSGEQAPSLSLSRAHPCCSMCSGWASPPPGRWGWSAGCASRRPPRVRWCLRGCRRAAARHPSWGRTVPLFPCHTAACRPRRGAGTRLASRRSKEG